MQQALQDEKMLQLQAGLAKIKEKFIEGLADKAAELDALLDALYDEGDVAQVVEKVGQRAHKLHGQAGSFGFADVGAKAANVERAVLAALDGPRPVNSEAVEAHLVDLLDQIDVSLNAV